MKKMYIILLAAAAAAVSCAKESFVEPSENSFRIAVTGTEATKSYLNDGYEIVWEAGKDEVSLFLKTDNNKLTAVSSGTSTWLEKKDALVGSTTKWAYALYPYDADATNSTGTVTTTLPAEQKAIPNQYSNIVAVGAINEALSLFDRDSLLEGVQRHIPAGTEELNRKALEEGEKLIPPEISGKHRAEIR